MGIMLAISYSWYDAYPDPEELEQVQASVDQLMAQRGKPAVDWEALFANELDKPPHLDFSYSYSPFFSAQLCELCDDLKASHAIQVDLLPIDLEGESFTFDLPDKQTWRVYSIPAMQRRTPRGEELANIVELAKRHQAGDNSNAAVSAFCVIAFMQFMDTCMRTQLPARIHF